jgi:hypothetical protein
MRFFSKIIVALIFIVTLLFPVKSFATKIELDSEDSYYQAMKYIYYTCGDYFDEHSLNPNREITKSEFLQILFCEKKNEDEIEIEIEIEIPFEDINGDEDFIGALKDFIFWMNIEKNDEETLFYPDKIITLEDALDLTVELDYSFEQVFLGPYIVDEVDEDFYLERAGEINLFDDIEIHKGENLLIKNLATILYRLDTIRVTNEKVFDEKLEDEVSYVNFMLKNNKKE